MFVVFARWWWAKVRRYSLWVVAAAWLEWLLYSRWSGSFTLSVQRLLKSCNCLFCRSECVLRCENPFDFDCCEIAPESQRTSFKSQRIFLLFRLVRSARHEYACKISRSRLLFGYLVANFICHCYCWVVGCVKIYFAGTIELYFACRWWGFRCLRTRSQCFARPNSFIFRRYLLVMRLRRKLRYGVRYCCLLPAMLGAEDIQPTKIIIIIISHTTLICFAGFPY